MKKILVLILAMFLVAFFSACKPVEEVVDDTDTEAPVITLSGGTNALEVGDVFEEPTCSVSDNVDTNLTCVKTGEVDVNTEGEYTLRYNVTDEAGNVAEEKTFVVVVVYIDSEIPVIVLTGGTSSLEEGDPFDAPVCTVIDNIDNDLTCLVTGEVDINQVGQYVLTYNATDLSGNVAEEVTFQVEVLIKLSQEEIYYNQVSEIGYYDTDTTDEEILAFMNLSNDNELYAFLHYAYDLAMYSDINLTVEQVEEMNDIYQSFMNYILWDQFLDQEFLYTEGDFIYIDSTKEVLVKYNGTDSDLTIPASVKIIGSGALLQKGLKTIDIPEGVTTICYGSIAHNMIEDLILPESVVSLGFYAFYGNPFAEITIEGDNTRFDEDWELFGFDYTLNTNYVYQNNFGFLTSIGEIVIYNGVGNVLNIPSEIEGEEVTSLKEGLFAYRGFTNVTIPESVVSIGYSAFAGNPISTLTIEGDQSRFDDVWKRIGLPYELAAFVVITDDGLMFNVNSGQIVDYNGTLTELVIPAEIDGIPVTSIGLSAFDGERNITSITIPDSVTVIEERAFASSKGVITTLDLGNGVQEIHGSAFKGHGLTSIVIPESVTYIGSEAFKHTNSIPNPVETITINGDETRFDDDWVNVGFPLELALFIEVTEDGFVFDKNKGEIVEYNGDLTDIVIPSEIVGIAVTVIGEECFVYKGLTSVTLPEGLTEIKEYAFYGNALTNISIPESVTVIGDQALSGNPLTTVSILGDELRFNDRWQVIGFPIELASFVVVTIDGLVFNVETGEIVGYSGVLTELIIPSEIEGVTVTSIGDNVFEGNRTITLVVIPDTVTNIGTRAFASSKGTLTTLILGNSVEVIGSEAFKGNGFTSIVIPESVTTIGYAAFHPTNSIPNPITSIVIHGDETRFYEEWNYIGFPMELAPFIVTTTDGIIFNKFIGEVTGYSGTLSLLVIPSEIEGVVVESIGAYAFYEKNLTSVVIPESVTTIGYNAFAYNALTSITIPGSVESIDMYAFYGNPLTIISIHGDSTRFDDDWEDIGFPIEIAPFIVVTEDGIIFDIVTGEIKGYNGTTTELVIPSEIDGVAVTSIRHEAFYNKGLTSVTLPDSITTIGYQAFRNNYLTSVIIPSSVTLIEGYAFTGNMFESIIIFGDASRFNSDWEYIGFPIELAPFIVTTSSGIVFNTYTGSIINYTGTLTEIIIPSEIVGYTVGMVSAYAFSNSGITSVILPDSITSIDYWAFGGNPLTSITIFGDASRFNDMWEYIGFPLELASFIVVTEDGILFNIETGEIVSYIGTLTDLVIPAEIEGIAVTGIRYQTFYSRGLNSVTLPEGLLSIGDYAFAYNNLTMITIPASVTTINYWAFGGNLFESIIILGDEARFDNYWESIGFPIHLAPFVVETVDGFVFNLNIGEIIQYNGLDTDLVIPAEIEGIAVTGIRYQTFYSKGINTVTLPEGLVSIGDYAFAYNNLTMITIPASVTTIDYWAFGGNLFESIIILGDEARFYDEWEYIGFPFNLAPFVVETVDGLVFNLLTGEIIQYNGVEVDVVIPVEIEGIAVTSIKQYTFYGRGVNSVTLPEGLVRIGEYAFAYNNLTMITIPASVTTINYWALGGNPLMSISILGDETRFYDEWEYIGLPFHLAPFVVETVDGFVFNLLTGEIVQYNGVATDLVIPSEIEGIAVTSIKLQAFFARGINTVTLPEGLVRIGESAFAYNNLTTITIPESVTTIDHWAFSGNPLTSITILGDETRFDNEWIQIGFPLDPTHIEILVVDIGDIIYASIGTQEERDYYSIEVVEPITIVIYTESGSDTYGELYDSNGFLLTADDDGGDGTNFRIQYLLNPGQTYYISVRAYYPYNTFDYTLFITEIV